MTPDTIDLFATTLHQEVLQLAESEGNETLLSEAFTQYMIDELIASGDLEDGLPCYFRARGMEVSGYHITPEGDVLDLMITRFNPSTTPGNLTRSDLETALRRLSGFLTKAQEGYHSQLEESSPVFDMFLSIYQARKTIERVQFFLLTNDVSRTEHKTRDELDGKLISYHIWDIQRLFRHIRSGRRREAIEIDLVQEFGTPIPCLPAPNGAQEHSSYLTILPGKVLENIYARYGPRLLELNVRSFLQVRGKVNNGVRKTILNQPERFLAYNNGISATAHSVEIVKMPDGGTGISSITGLQIVNGGQTTATIHYTARKDKADVEKISVQCKLTVVQEDLLSEVIPLISRYANTQNKVNEADFSANDAFHVRLEELSRTIWAPPTDGTQRQTKWFYERARGQYQDAILREGTPAKMRQFKQIHQPAQKFTKTDLAKYLNTWEQLPHLVSLGAQKNFAEFTLKLREQMQTEPDQTFFQRLIAKAILFKQTEAIVSSQQFGGYRANIVAYTIALLVHKTANRIDLDNVWNHQGLSVPVKEALRELSVKVHSVITSPPSGGNVTEWCKKKACWDAVRNIEWNIPPGLREILLSGQNVQSVLQQGDMSSFKEISLITSAARVNSETWFEVSRWAKETNSLHPWQRSLAFSMGKLASQGRTPTIKQATQGLRLLEQAKDLGFDHAGVTIET